MSNVNWRSINVAQYFEDMYEEPEEVKWDNSGVETLIENNDYQGALFELCSNPPENAIEVSKAEARGYFCKILSKTKNSEFSSFVKTLDPFQLTNCMKYIYVAFEQDEVKKSGGKLNGKLLQWHGKVKDLGGVGCVVRAMVSRATL